MKNTVKFFLLIGMLFPYYLLAQTRCDTLGDIVKGMLNENNETFYSNGQSYKYFLSGEGHIVDDFSLGKEIFLHEDI